MDRIDRDALAQFLRLRRAAIRPADVGLEPGRRRRVPGLRRQEVAELAGMSVDYYIRLEQARGPSPSREILGAVARALQLSDGERSYLFDLARVRPPAADGPAAEVRPGVLRMRARLDDAPALVCDARYDVLAWNPMATALLRDYSTLPREDRNVVLQFFTDPAARERHDADGAREFARAAVADLRAASARYPNDARLRHMITRLRAASDEFAELWSRQEVAVHRSSTKRLRHPDVGWLELDCEGLHDPDRDHWVIVYTAAPGTPTHQALQLLRVIGTEAMATAAVSTAATSPADASHADPSSADRQQVE